MADVLIKGMEMPIDCFHCAFEYDNECVADNDNRTTNLNGRPEWCSLVEIPTHGDLIDHDELIENAKTLATIHNGRYEELFMAFVMSIIECTPTVIEASEGGEQDG